LGRLLRGGTVQRTIRNPAFDLPTTVAPYRGFLYAVNFDDEDRNPREDVVRVSTNR